MHARVTKVLARSYKFSRQSHREGTRSASCHFPFFLFPFFFFRIVSSLPLPFLLVFFFFSPCYAHDYRCRRFDGNRQSIDARRLRRPFPSPSSSSSGRARIFRRVFYTRSFDISRVGGGCPIMASAHPLRRCRRHRY